jgi:hypothetical protein
MEAIMFELQVYYHDVLRYTIIANWDKVQELRNLGFHVQIKEAPSQGLGSGGWHSSASHPVHEEYGATAHHDDEFGLHELAGMQQDVERYALDFY